MMLTDNKSQVRKVFDEDMRNTSHRRTAVRQIADKKKSQLKKPLIEGTDEESDEEGNTVTRPVAIDSKQEPYQPPNLSINMSFATDSTVDGSRLTETQQQQKE